MGQWLQLVQHRPCTAANSRFESELVHKYRDSNGGHGRKPTLKGDPVKAFADSEYRKWNGESEYSWSGNETDSWAEVREGFDSPMIFKRKRGWGTGTERNKSVETRK